LNSGSANACTGAQGFQLAHTTAEEAARLLSRSGDQVGAIEVAVCSTGLIGELPPKDALLGGLPVAVAELVATPEAGLAAADAVRTTDTVPKQAAVRHADGWTVGGFAKGAGMLAPGLATMLVVLSTDAVADGSTLDSALRAATSVTFDRLDVDGSCSTNDTVLLLASGASGCVPTDSALTDAVRAVCADLAEQLQSDAEGVTKRVAITVTGARSEVDAVTVARAVTRDRLVATAMFGADPNWGRIIAAVGASPVPIEPDSIDVTINGVTVCRGGTTGEPREKTDLSGADIAVRIDLHLAAAQATVRTTDLSHGYVEENSAYSS
jgi:glutamate N-acetyltransferase/amino-acid N-acetyltransferase